jgi:hypothetical protein
MFKVRGVVLARRTTSCPDLLREFKSLPGLFFFGSDLVFLSREF